MIQVEVALAQAQAQVGVIPQNAANTIAQVAEQALEKFDFSALAVATGLAGNIAIPFVKQLTAIVKDTDEDASRYVHWGATSQDILDTACILQCRDALNIVEGQLQQCYTTALHQAKQYRHQVMIGRTWLQQALPITLGHKLARWASAFKRDLDRIQAMKSRVLTAQLGGAVGSLASLQDQGSLVVSAFAKQLNLTVPTSTWRLGLLLLLTLALGIVVGLLLGVQVFRVFQKSWEIKRLRKDIDHLRKEQIQSAQLAAAEAAANVRHEKTVVDIYPQDKNSTPL